MRFLAMILASLLGGSSAVAQTPTPGSFADYWSTLNEEQRAGLVRRSAKEGAYFPGVDYCGYLDEFADLSFYLSVTFEPFGAACLNTLAGLLPSLASQEATAAASILYRYDHPSGRVYLSEAVRHRRDPEAATVLAMNRESEPLDDVAQAFRRARYPPSELTAALAAWGIPKANALLLEKFRENPRNADLMMGVGVARLGDAEGLLEAQYQDAPPDAPRKLAAAAALARVRADPSSYVQFLIAQLSTPPPSEQWRLDVISALGVAGGTQAEVGLSGLITQYLDTDAIPGVDAEVAAEMSVAAAKSLAHLNAQTSNAVIVALLHKFASPIRVSGLDRKRGVLGNALLDLDSVNGQEAIRNELGESWLQRLLAVRALKRVPRSLVPRKSRDVEYYRDFFWSTN